PKMDLDTYSFDAPMTFNFTDLHEQEDDMDSWFEKKAEVELVPEMDQKDNALMTPLKKWDPLLEGKGDLPHAIVMPMMKVESSKENDASDGKFCLEPVLINQCFIGKVHISLCRNGVGTPKRVSRRVSGQQKSEQQRKQLAKIRAGRQMLAASVKQEDAPPPMKKQKVTRSNSKGNFAEGSSIASQNTTQSGQMSFFFKPSKTNFCLSLACLPPPHPFRRQTLSSRLKSTEQQELEKMQQLQQEVAEHRRKNEESYKAAIAGEAPAVRKVVIPATKPVDFHFRTDERIKQHGEAKSEEPYKEVNFTSELRRHPPSPARFRKGPTVPKPFNLSCSSKRKYDEVSSGYLSLAEQVEAFQKRTPPRYHLRSHKQEAKAPTLYSAQTVFQIPKPVVWDLFRCKKNVTGCPSLPPPSCKKGSCLHTSASRFYSKYKFKAVELDPKILEGGPILPKKPQVKEPTKAVGFELEIEKRLKEREATRKELKEEKPVFHSKPCPVKILEDVVGVPEKKLLKITVPKSPAFALKNRVRIPRAEEEEEELLVIKANPMPHYGIPFKPKPLENRNVEICPFSFDSRDKERQVLKEKKMEELRKDEVVPKFKATPLPDFESIHLPDKKVKSPTNLEPFQLRIDSRGAAKAERWGQMIQEEFKHQKEAACFKARPNVVIHQEPFVPKKENKKPIENISGSIVVEGFELATEKRAKERLEYEKRLAEQEALRERLEQEKLKQQEEQEKEEIGRLRNEIVHKAQPVHKYKSVEVKRSEQQLTIPQSPKFSDRFRC
uniref:TPX2 microtubule nucleation factor n=1 Tax=Latimeria chalumnae TaxID=7897 RepID=H3ALN4_LATCH